MAFGRMGARFGRDAVIGGTGSGIFLSGSSIVDTASLGTTIGTLSVKGATGTPAYTLTDPSGLFTLSAGVLKVNASLTGKDGSYSITISVTGMTPSLPNKSFLITVTPVVTGYVPTFELIGF